MLTKMRSSARRSSDARHVPRVAGHAAQRLAHALGQAGGAGGEHDHRELVLAHGAVVRHARPIGGRPALVPGGAQARHQARLILRHQEPPRAGRVAAVLARHEQEARPRLGDEPGDVGGGQAGVERHHDAPGEPHPEHRDEEGVVLLQMQGDAIAALRTGGRQGGRDPLRACQRVAVRVRATARREQQRVRPLGRPAAQARHGVGHEIRRHPAGEASEADVAELGELVAHRDRDHDGQEQQEPEERLQAQAEPVEEPAAWARPARPRPAWRQTPRPAPRRLRRGRSQAFAACLDAT